MLSGKWSLAIFLGSPRTVLGLMLEQVAGVEGPSTLPSARALEASLEEHMPVFMLLEVVQLCDLHPLHELHSARIVLGHMSVDIVGPGAGVLLAE